MVDLGVKGGSIYVFFNLEMFLKKTTSNLEKSFYFRFISGFYVFLFKAIYVGFKGVYTLF
jgi:hypothetical protein